MKIWTPIEIKALRNRLGKTQSAFADQLGLTEQYIYLLETGRRRPSKPLQQLLTYVDKEANNDNKTEQE